MGGAEDEDMKSALRFLAMFTGVFAFGWLGVVLYSALVLGRLEPWTDPAAGGIYPAGQDGLVRMGERVYAANGCLYCHTQAVRSASLSADLDKKLGPRRLVARDFLNRGEALAGLLRMGPDLSNYGLRAPSAAEIHRHLFEPAIAVPGSDMPSYRFLYKTRRISGERAWNAVGGLSGPHAPQAGYEVVPSEEAEALVAYLLSLKRDYPLPEAPKP